MRVFITALILCIFWSMPLRAAEKRLYAAINYVGKGDSDSVAAENSGLGQFGIYPKKENSYIVLIYPIQIPDQSTVTKIIVYAKNTDKISTPNVFNMYLEKLSKQGTVVEQFNFIVPTGANSADKKITFNVDSGMKINYKKYDYIMVVSLGDVNNLLTDTTGDNNHADVPIFQAFKIVYELT